MAIMRATMLEADTRPVSSTKVVLAVLEEARPKVLVIGGLRFAAGALLSGGLLFSVTMLTGLTAWVLLTIAVYVLNGLTDIVADRTNGSTRPVASGRLSVRAGRAAVWVSMLSAVALSLTVSWAFAAHLIIALVLGVRYSTGARPAKASSTGAFLTVVAGGLLTYHAGLLAGGGSMTVAYVVFSTSLSLWIGVGSIAKDLTDIDGDRAAGRHTLAVVRGATTAAACSAGAAVAIAVGLLWASTGEYSTAAHLRLTAIVIVLGTTVLTLISMDVIQRHWAYRTFMYTQFVAHGSLLAIV